MRIRVIQLQNSPKDARFFTESVDIHAIKLGLRTSTRASVYKEILACTRVHFKYSVTREILYYRPRNETFM